MNTGIYKIHSKIKPERIYIGSAVNIYQRWHHHWSSLKKGDHHSKKLQRHYEKYGKEDLVFSIITCCDKENLLTFEQFYIDALAPYFNSLKTAGSCLGCKRSEETRRKISESKKGKPTGIVYDEERRRKMSMAQKGIKKRGHTPEEIEKIRKASTGSNNGHWGKSHTVEAKKRISESKKGRTAWNKGRPWSEEIKQKIRASQPGKRAYGEEWSNRCKEFWVERKRKKQLEYDLNIK